MSEPHLPHEWRAELVALLSRGSDQARIARSLGQLADDSVEAVSLEIVSGDLVVRTDPLPFHLAHAHDSVDGRVTGATLFITPAVVQDLYGLSQALADYLGDVDRVDLINSYLMARESVLAKKRVTLLRIEEAKALIEKYAVDAPEDQNVARTLAESSPWSSHDAEDGDPDGMDDLDIPWPETAPPKRRVGNGTSGGAGAARTQRVVRSDSERASGGASGDGSASGLGNSHRNDARGNGIDTTAWSVDPSAGFAFESTPASAKEGSKSWTGRKDSADGGSVGAAPSLERREVDDRAIRIAIAFGESLGSAVKRVDDQNLGWDLEFQFDDVWWPIEVKGMADERDGFIITRNELRAAEQEPGFRYLVVTGVRGQGGDVVLIEAATNPLGPDRLEAMSWVVPMWRALGASAESRWSGSAAAQIAKGEPEAGAIT